MSTPKKLTPAAELRELRKRIKVLRQLLREHNDYTGRIGDMIEKSSSEELRAMLLPLEVCALAETQGLLWAVKILDGSEVQVHQRVPPE
jgi:hypothetical protein